MFWSTQTKLKGLTPAIGASPNFVLPQKVLSDSNNSKTDVISAADLNFSQSEPETDTGYKLQDPSAEKAKIVAALEQAEGNKTLAAKLLKIDRSTLYVKMHQYSIK